MTAAPLTTPQQLARTYSAQAYADSWEIVEDYQRFLEYTGRRPNAGSQRIASALELPRGRVRPWKNGSIPHPVRGIQVAETNDWLPLEESSDVFEPINRLAAWMCAAGTIKATTPVPYVRVNDADRDRLEDLFTAVGLETETTHVENTRSTEIRPREDGAVFGRLLLTLGLVTDDDHLETVPPYLERVSADARRNFAQTYLYARGDYWEFTDQWVIEHQNRPSRYLRSLADLFESVGVDVEVHDESLSIDDHDATDAFGGGQAHV